MHGGNPTASTSQPADQVRRDRHGRFVKGVSGNPGGRPSGRRRAGPNLTLQELRLYYSRRHAENLWSERLADALRLERLAEDEAWLALEAKYRLKHLRQEWDELVQREYVRLGGTPQW